MTQEWISIHRQHYDQSLGVVQMEKMRGGRGTWWAQFVDGDREIWSVVEIFPNERNPTKLGTLQLDLSPPRLLGRFHKLKNCEWVRQGPDFERCMVLCFLDLPTGEVHRTPVNGSFGFCGNPSIILTFMTRFNYMTTYICICIYVLIYTHVFYVSTPIHEVWLST